VRIDNAGGKMRVLITMLGEMRRMRMIEGDDEFEEEQ
jgi:hypothetical protein